jgi:tRNA-specific adenosine deaminase 2
VNSLHHPAHPPYRATGGLLRDEAIMILRRFYITENNNGVDLFFDVNVPTEYTLMQAPTPKSKVNRVLKTDISPLPP